MLLWVVVAEVAAAAADVRFALVVVGVVLSGFRIWETCLSCSVAPTTVGSVAAETVVV